jgi:hypothetical protein
MHVGFRIATLLAVKKDGSRGNFGQAQKASVRAAGAIADFRIAQSSGRTFIEIQPGDSLEGEELRDFVAELMGNDLEHDQIIVVAAIK